MNTSNESDSKLINQLSSTLDKSTDELDDITLARLAGARRKALELENSIVDDSESMVEKRFPYLTAVAASVLLMVIAVPVFRDSMRDSPESHDYITENIVIEYWEEDPDFLDTMDMLAALGDESSYEVL